MSEKQVKRPKKKEEKERSKREEREWCKEGYRERNDRKQRGYDTLQRICMSNTNPQNIFNHVDTHTGKCARRENRLCRQDNASQSPSSEYDARNR